MDKRKLSVWIERAGDAMLLGPLVLFAYWPWVGVVLLLALALAWKSWGLVAVAAVVAIIRLAFRWLEDQARVSFRDPPDDAPPRP